MAGVALLGLALAGLNGCATPTPTSAPTDASATHVVATTSIWGDVVRQITDCGGGTVTTLIPSGADPHDYSPSASDVVEMVHADLVVANGLGLEEGLATAMAAAREDDAHIYDVGPYLDPQPLAEAGEEESSSGLDPHVFLDPVRVAKGAELIGAQLTATTGHDYGPCAAKVAASISAAGDEAGTIMSVVPADRRILVTDHDALGYFARRYNFRIAGVVIPGGSTLAQPSSSGLADLAETVRTTGVPAIFANTAHNTDLTEALAGEVGNVKVVPLYVDSLGAPGSGADSYQGLIRTDATRIADSLGQGS